MHELRSRRRNSSRRGRSYRGEISRRSHDRMMERRSSNRTGRRTSSYRNRSREPMYDERAYGYAYAQDEDYYNSDEYDDYCDELDEWIEKLEKKTKFKDMSYDDIIKKAEEMDIKFEDYSEDEFYATYLMLASDYDFVANNPETYIAMAKAFLEDDDIEVEPSEKLCIYLEQIVLGEE